MKLNQDPAWVSVTHGDEEILRSQKESFSYEDWEYLVDHVEVRPLSAKGYYEVAQEYF